MNRFNTWKLLTLLFLLLTIGCGGRHNKVLDGLEELQGTHVAVLDASVSDAELELRCPHARADHFKSTSEFLLALAVGKCKAGIAKTEDAAFILKKNHDYGLVPGQDLEAGDSIVVIAHCSRLPETYRTAVSDNMLKKSIRRIDDNLIADNYWRLILNGLCVTVVIFVFGLLLAVALAILIIWMSYQENLKWLARPIFVFVRTIHDVPSVVLIFFFYYLVFASVPVSGIVVCIISLGVYSSGSFMNVLNVHLGQIDQTQHYAAQMLGMDGWKKYRYVILPQAVKSMLPLLGAESKVLLRATSYAGYISQIDLVKVTEIIRNQTYDVLVPLLFVSLVFLLLSWLIVEGLALLYKKMFSYD